MTVTSLGGIIDQRATTGEERLAVAGALRDAWWDCHLAFLGRLVDVHSLGLTEASLTAMAQDLDDAGLTQHAQAVRAALVPVRRLPDSVAPARFTRRTTHARRAVAARH